MTWDPPGEFEEYRILRSLGAGAMGLVFLAHDTLLDRQVAIKFVGELDVGSTARERFFTEARAVARLSHPNVVAVHRVGEVRQRPYLVSEYVRGQSLAAVPKPLPWERVLKIALGLARGLGAAHRGGVLHRDIKPANVMLGEDDEAKLLDFGLAKLGTAGATESAVAPPPTPHLPGRRLSSAHEVDATLSMAASVPDLRGRGRAAAGSDPALDPEGLLRLASAAMPAVSPAETSPLLHAGSRPATAPGHAPPTDARSKRTHDGALIGTPLYLAPELWSGAPASQASDIYALGIVLYELLTGHAPHVGRSLVELAQRVPDDDISSITTRVSDLPAQLAEIIDACIARDPAQRPGSADALCDRLAAVIPRATPILVGSPYRGLATFQSEHRAMFFGRATEERAVIERLRTETLVIVAGDSGAGKSSLCRAAVLPAITEKSLAGTRWRVATMVPGTRPAARLEAILAARDPDEGLLVFIDQLEELLTIAEPGEAATFAERLAELVVAASSVRVLASARSDFLGRLAGMPGLGELVGRALFLLGPLKDRGLLDAILGPARASGYSFESSATVDELVASGRRHLPLLQFALSELWEARDPARKLIPADALARIGGVTGALARHADHVLAGLPPSHRKAARAIFLALVTEAGTRGRRSHAELVELASGSAPCADAGRARAALDALVRGRLLVIQETESGEDSDYAIAHEALLDGWEVLRRWLGEDAEGRATRQRIERAAAEWDRLGRPADALWSERLLREAVAIDASTLPARDAAFLAAGRRMASRRRVRRWAVILAVPVAAAAVGLVLHVKAAHARAAIVADARQLVAQAHVARDRYEGLRRTAYARFDRGAPDAERAWREALDAEPAVERGYAGAAEQLERLLQDDPGARDARELLSDVLVDRAALADENGRGAERDELVRRLGLYGARDRWTAPARLSIETRPPGATVTLRRYELVDGRWTASPATRLGTTPLSQRPLAAGSVVLELARPDRAPVRVPVVLARGRATPLALQLPAAASVPAGFVYVPEGAFLYGSAGGEDARQVHDSQPIHPVTTRPYLIADHETTFGEWIAFLRALPGRARAERMTRANRESFVVELTELPGDVYQLTLGTEKQLYTVREGEPLRYAGRSARATQDWSRLPVSGVSFEDALAYTAWLRTTGRVPGARPCTEHEWERAARGADGRAFPGGEQLAADDANHDLTYGRTAGAYGPDEVGSHPASDSPFGVHDLSGNVWEWTSSMSDPRLPVARGGGFFQAVGFVRPEERSADSPDRRDAFYGIRVCAGVPVTDGEGG